MGFVATITHDSFPKQSEDVGRAVLVVFQADPQHVMKGKLVRDDTEHPYRTIIRLEDGRHVMATECQYRLARRDKERGRE